MIDYIDDNKKAVYKILQSTEFFKKNNLPDNEQSFSSSLDSDDDYAKRLYDYMQSEGYDDSYDNFSQLYRRRNDATADKDKATADKADAHTVAPLTVQDNGSADDVATAQDTDTNDNTVITATRTQTAVQPQHAEHNGNAAPDVHKPKIVTEPKEKSYNQQWQEGVNEVYDALQSGLPYKSAQEFANAMSNPSEGEVANVLNTYRQKGYKMQDFAPLLDFVTQSPDGAWDNKVANSYELRNLANETDDENFQRNNSYRVRFRNGREKYIPKERFFDVVIDPQTGKKVAKWKDDIVTPAWADVEIYGRRGAEKGWLPIKEYIDPQKGELPSAEEIETAKENNDRAFAYKKSMSVDQAKGLEDKISKMEKLAREEEDKRPHGQFSFLQLNPMQSGGLGPRQTENSDEFNDTMSLLGAARLFLKDAKKLVKEADISRKEGNDIGAFLRGAGRGLIDKLFDVRTWDMGLSETATGLKLIRVLNKADKGLPLSQPEQAMLDAKAVEMATNAYFSSYVGRGYKAGQVTAESLPFMLEMMINPASAIGRSWQSMLTRYALKRFGKSALKKSAGKYLAAKIGARLAGDVVGAGVMAGTTGIGHVASDVLHRQVGDVQFKHNIETGKVEYDGRTNKESFGSALYKAYTSQAIENYSEMFGEYFKPILGAAGKGIAKGVGKVKGKIPSALSTSLDAVQEFISGVNKSKFAKAMNDFEKRAKWSGTIPEYAEEVVGNVLNGLLVGDQTFDTDKDTGIFNLDNNIDTFLGVALMGGFMSAVKTAGYRTPKYEAKQAMQKADRAAMKMFEDEGNEEEWIAMRYKIENGKNEDIKEVVADVLVSDYDEKKKRAILEYVARSQMYKGFSQQENADEQDSDEGEAVVDNDNNQQGQGVVDADDNATVTVEGGIQPTQETAQTEQVDPAQAEYDNQRQSVSDELFSGVRNAGLVYVAPDGQEGIWKMTYRGKEWYVTPDNTDNSVESVKLQDENGNRVVVDLNDPDLNLGAFIPLEQMLDNAMEQRGISVDGIRQEYDFAQRHNPQTKLLNVGDTYTAPNGEKMIVVGEADGNLVVRAAQFDEGQGKYVGDPKSQTRELSQEDAANEQDAYYNSLVHNQPTQQEDAEQSQETAYVKPSEHEGKFGIGDKMTFYVDGKPIEAEVVQTEDVDGVVVQTSERVNGHLINQYTREELDALTAPPQQANDNADVVSPKTPEAGAEVQNETGEEEKSPDELPAFDGDKFNETHPADEIRPTEEQNPNEENNAVDEASAISKIPQDEGGEYDYMQAEPSKAWAALLEQTEGDADMAREVAISMLDDKVTELEEAQKQQPKEGKSVAEKIAARKEHKANIERIEKEIEQWQQIIQSGEEREAEEKSRSEEADEMPAVDTKPESGVDGEEKSEDMLQPIGKGVFGNIYDQFKGKVKEAFDFLTKHKSGDLLGVFHRDGFGDIDLVWGDNGGGLAHIIQRHVEEQNDFNSVEEVRDVMDDVIKNGSINERKSKWDKVVFEKDGYSVVVSRNLRDKDGNIIEQNKDWVVTAFDNSRGRNSKKRESSSDVTQVTPNTNKGGRAVAPNDNSSESKDTKSKAEGQEKSEESKETSLSEQISRASAEVNTDPTDAQKEAGNFKKGHVQVGTFDITIEQPQGSIRRGTDANGKKWESKMHNTYGYFRGTEGVDGDHIDVFLSNDIDGWNGRKVFVVDQYNPDGTFDEHKVMLGFNDIDDAKSDYLANYEKGWENGRRIDVTPVSLEDFEKWIGSSHRKTKAFAEYAGVKKETEEKPQSEKGGKVPFHKAGESNGELTKAEVALRDAVVDQLRENGMDVITDVSEGQRVLDMANGNGEETRLMSVDERKERIEQINKISPERVEDKPTTRKEARSAYAELKPVEKDGATVEFYNSAFGKAWHGEDCLFGKIIPKIREIFKSSVLAYSETDNLGGKLKPDGTIHKKHPNIKAFHNYVGKVIIGNKPYYVRFTVQEGTDAKQGTHNFFVSDISLYNNTVRNVTTDTNNTLGNTNTDGIVDAKLKNFFETSDGDGQKFSYHRVYHGSGADFDSFDHSHMGEGEGAQAYGWGTYVTEVEGIGRTYAEANSKRPSTHYEYGGDTHGLSEERINEILEVLLDAKPSDGHIVSEYEDALGWYRNRRDEYSQSLVKDASLLNPSDISIVVDKTRTLYSVEIPEDNGKNYLDWNERLSDSQIEAIRAYLSENYRRNKLEDFDASIAESKGAPNADEVNAWARKGKNVYKTLSHLLGSDDAASKALSEMGYVGIKYPAENRSGGRKDGAKNYVIFNENDAKIVDKVRFFKTANGEAYGFVVGGKIYIDPRIASSETSVHEYAHLWAEALRSANAKEWSNVVGLMRGTSVWNEVSERYPELKSDDEIADEVLATYSGRRGSERLREEMDRIKGSERSVSDKARALGALERVRRALDRFWHGVADFLGIHYGSADEVADRVMRDLLSGVDPRRLAQKKVQNDIVQRENPMLDDYHTGIRSEDDIHTFAEAVSEAQREKEKYGDEQMSSYPDITDSLLNEAIKTGKITIYSSKPIKDGVFVTPSRMQAQDYAGGRGAKVYSKEVSIESVAWIDVDEGQFAEVKNAPMDKIRFQYIGEMGAESADRADEVSTRLDNLRVAREMESDNRDAKSIKLATGWERGADGKWRYEIPDLKYFGKGDAGYKKVRGKQPWSKELDGLSDRIFDGEELSAEEQRRFEELAQEEENFKTDYLNREKPHLADWVENDELFKAYPELKRVKLVFSDQLPANVGGSYNEREHTIVVNRNYVGGDTSSVLAHEVQHAIQYIEGFARGGNTDQLERDFDAAKAEWRARSYAHELEEKAKELGGDYDQLGVERALIREYEDMDMLDWLPDKETRIKGFNYFARGYADRSMDDAIRRFRLNESTRSDFNSYLEYQKLGGEVEARNVVKRMGMSADERRASLAEETEDVSREDQIFLRGEGGVQSMSYDYEKYPTGKVEPNLADKEIGIVQAKSNHGFKNFGEAKEWAKNNIARTYDNEETGGKGNIRISNTAIGKFLTQSAVDKSESKDVHLAVLKVLPDVIRESVDAETHPDFNKDGNEVRSAENSVNKNVLMHRLYGAVDIDGKTYRVKVTLKEDKQNENLPQKAYSYEATKIELLTGTLGKPEDDAPRANNSITGAKLLKDVGMSYDPTKKLLDESKKNETDTTLFRDEVDGVVSSSGVDGMRERAVELGRELGADVDVVSDVSEITDPNPEVQERKRRAKGWYDAKTGRVVINLAAHSDMADVEQTLLHEIVGHRGLRGLVGHENFNGFLDGIYKHASDVVREGIDDIARRKGCSKRVATEEYMSGLAEGGFADRKNAGLWQQIRQWFGDMLSRAKIKLNFSISDNELRYLLWRSHELSRMNGREGVVGRARDLAMQNRLGVGNGVRKAGERAADSYDGDLETLFRDADSHVDYERALIRDSYERRLKDAWFQSREALQDGMLSLKETMKDIWQSAGKKFSQITDIPDYANPYIGQNRLSSRNAAEVRDFKRRLFRPLLREVGRLTGFSADGRAKLTDYMMAKHGLERNKVMAERVAKAAYETEKLKDPNTTKTLADFVAEYRKKDYSGLTSLTGLDDVAAAEAEAKNMVADYEANHDTANLWARTKAVTDAIVEKQYDSGYINSITRNAILNMYDNYIPLRGFEDKTAEDVYSYMKHSNSAFNAPIKTARGRKSKADDPFANMLAMAESGIMRGNRNKLVKLPLLSLVLEHPTDLISVSDVWLKYNDALGEWEVVNSGDVNGTKAIDVNDTPEEVESKMVTFNGMMTALAAHEPDKYRRQADFPDIPYRVINKSSFKEHQIVITRNGRDYVLTINGNPHLAQVINGLANPDVKENIAMKVTRYLSKIYTQLSADFAIANGIRDMIYSNTSAWVKEGRNYGLAFTAHFAVNVPRMYKLYYKHLRGTLNENNRAERLFKEFMSNGGETGYHVLPDMGQRKSDIDKELKRLNGKVSVKKAFGWLVDTIDYFNKVIENTARFSAYQTSRQFGRTVGQSINNAKEISVNFNTKGAGTAFMNSKDQKGVAKVVGYIAKYGRNYIPFFNAAIQGTTNKLSQIKHHKVAGTAQMTGMFGLGFVMGMLGFGGDDDDDDKYANIPDFVRRNNITFKVGSKTYITIPLPVEDRIIYGLGELAASIITNGERLSPEEASYQVASLFSQLLPVDFTEGGNPLTKFVPGAFKPIVEVALNQSWTGMPIYKDNVFNENVPEYLSVYSNTSKPLVEISKYINELTGGDPHTRSVEINPAAVEYLLSAYFGGLYNLGNRALKTVETIAGTREFNPSSIPVVNRLVKSPDDRTEYRQINNEFYKIGKDAEKLDKRLNSYKNDTRYGIADYADKIRTINYSPEYRYMLIYQAVEPHINKLEKKLKDNTLTDSSRKEVESSIQGLKKLVVERVWREQDNPTSKPITGPMLDSEFKNEWVGKRPESKEIFDEIANEERGVGNRLGGEYQKRANDKDRELDIQLQRLNDRLTDEQRKGERVVDARREYNKSVRSFNELIDNSDATSKDFEDAMQSIRTDRLEYIKALVRAKTSGKR